MTIKGAVREIVTSNSLTRTWLESRLRQRRQRDWSTVSSATFASTTLSLCTTVGMGDLMVASQVCQEFVSHCRAFGDPKLGRIVITAGAWPHEFKIPSGDHNIYWWWSMNGRQDWLDRYLEHTNVEPDVIACPSHWCCQYAQALQMRTLYLPLAAGEQFRPLDLRREGMGYAGSKGHKDVRQLATLIEPFTSDANFEWPSGFTTPGQINDFYNRKSIILGMTEQYQEQAGMVNNRVFEVLASGTPFIIHRHRALEEVLGHPFPYQSASPEQSRDLANKIMADFPTHLAAFDNYRTIVEAKHRYSHRVKNLLDFLGETKPL